MEDELSGQEEQNLDYLAPFLIQIGYREKMTKGQALRLRDDCLTDFKCRLIDKANIIQARFEKVLPASLQDVLLLESLLYWQEANTHLIVTAGKKQTFDYFKRAINMPFFFCR